MLSFSDMADARTVADTQSLLEFAKLNPCDFRTVPQTIIFDEELNAADLFLFEIGPEVMKHLDSGKKVMIKGDNSESAVACTESETFFLREAETSNSLLFLPDMTIPKKDSCQENSENESLKVSHVVAMRHIYFEMKRCRPVLGKLKKILDDSAFIGHVEDAADESVIEHCLTFDQILEQVQASETELRKALEDFHAIELDGFIRVLDFDYTHLVLQSCLDLIEEQDWSTECFPLKEMCYLLEQAFPPNVVEAVIGQFKKSCHSDGTYSLNPDKICAHIGEYLLRNTTKFQLDEFEVLWQEAVPVGMKVSFQQLRGVVLVDQQGEPPSVSLFRKLDLPENEEQRFEFLFEKKAKWLFDEIEPFIADIASETCSVSALLTKNCRVSHAKNGEKLYSSRKLR